MAAAAVTRVAMLMAIAHRQCSLWPLKATTTMMTKITGRRMATDLATGLADLATGLAADLATGLAAGLAAVMATAQVSTGHRL